MIGDNEVFLTRMQKLMSCSINHTPSLHNGRYTKRIFNITLRSVSYRYSYPLERSRSTDLETSRLFYERF